MHVKKLTLHSQLTTMHVKKLTQSKLDSCDDGLEDDGGGDSPLIVNVEEAVASIPGDILDPPSDLTRALAATVASPESVSEDAPTPESLETAESSVVSLCQVLQLSHHSLLQIQTSPGYWRRDVAAKEQEESHVQHCFLKNTMRNTGNSVRHSQGTS